MIEALHIAGTMAQRCDSFYSCCIAGVIGDQCTTDLDCSDAVTFSECDVTKYSCRCDEEHLPTENGTVCAIRTLLWCYLVTSFVALASFW